MASSAKALLQHGLLNTPRDAQTFDHTKDEALKIEGGKTHIM